jgi:hypothetical protein
MARLPTVAPSSVHLAATPRVVGLNYVTFSGWQVEPIGSTQTWARNGGFFRYVTNAAQGWCSVPLVLPVGSVIKEVEVYGTTTAGSSAFVEIWQTIFAPENAVMLTQTAIPAGPGAYTVTVPANYTVNDTTQYLPFINILDTTIGATHVGGVRIGYVGVPQTPAFVALNPTPRVYNTRDTVGLTKLDVGEERTIALPVPVGVSAAVIQLTVTQTGTGGYVAVFPASAPSWPGNSSINWTAANSDVGNTVVSATSSDGKIKIRGGGTPTHVIIDVPGYLV